MRYTRVHIVICVPRYDSNLRQVGIACGSGIPSAAGAHQGPAALHGGEASEAVASTRLGQGESTDTCMLIDDVRVLHPRCSYIREHAYMLSILKKIVPVIHCIHCLI
jgi:hypothetical protein